MQSNETKIPTRLSYRRWLVLLIICLSVIRGIIAFYLELGSDESYYWLYSQSLQWNYFDHPPIVALWIRLFTANLGLEDYEVFIRLGSIAGCALATWFMYKAVALIHSERAGWFAACLYNASFYAGLTAGTYAMPDSPQLVFWTFCLWMIARICKRDKQWINWVGLGIAAGLCIMSKVHGGFIWSGLGLFILFQKREWLLKPQFYTALLLTLLIVSPILIWNMQNDFITYRFHSQRVAIRQFSFNSSSFIRECLSQLFFNNPFNVALLLVAMIQWRRHALKLPVLSVYNFIAVPMALVLLLFISPFIKQTMPYWSGPAYVTLLPAAAIYLAEINEVALFPNWIRWSLGTFLVAIIGYVFITHLYSGTLGSKSKENLGSGDISLDNYGWEEAGEKFARLYQDEVRRGIMPAGAPVVCSYWWGAHQEYYFCRPFKIQMMGLGNINDIHHYAWTNKKRKDKVNLEKAYCIIPSDEKDLLPFPYNDFYSTYNLIAVIDIYRNKRPAHSFYVYRLEGWKNQLPVVP